MARAESCRLLSECQYGYTRPAASFLGMASLGNASLVRSTYIALAGLYLIFLSVPGSYAQEKPQAPAPKKERTPAAPARSRVHPFWDETNGWLFAGTGAARTLDYFSTLNMRRRGRQEILLTNDVVDNHAAFATIEAAGTAVSIGAAYLFHRTGHHTLERWASIVHLSAATTGSAR